MSSELAAGFERLLEIDGRSFADAVIVSGIDARQLRNGLDRGALTVGQKLRVGRWAFTGRDLLELMIINRLTTRAWMPVAQAAIAARTIADHAKPLFEALQTSDANTETRVADVIIRRADDGPEVIFYQRGADWGYYDTEWRRLSDSSFDDAHIRLPVIGMLSDFLHGCQTAFGSDAAL